MCNPDVVRSGLFDFFSNTDCIPHAMTVNEIATLAATLVFAFIVSDKALSWLIKRFGT